MVVRNRSISELLSGVDETALLTYYDCTPQDWEEVSDDRHFVEFIDGRLLVHSPAGLRHQFVFGFVFRLFSGYVESRDLGHVLSGPFAMELAAERKFEPDLIYVSHATGRNLTETRLVGPADVAVEIASPSTGGYDRGEKRECYRVAGVREYWVIDPARRVLVLDRPAGHEVTRCTDGVVQSELLPGFWLRAEWLWGDPLPAVGAALTEIGGGLPN